MRSVPSSPSRWRPELPVFLHQRDAHDDFVEVLEPVLPKLSRAVAHCFTGEHESLREYLAMGLYIGVTGWICDERRGTHLKEIVSDRTGRPPHDRDRRALPLAAGRYSPKPTDPAQRAHASRRSASCVPLQRLAVSPSRARCGNHDRQCGTVFRARLGPRREATTSGRSVYFDWPSQKSVVPTVWKP